MKIIRDTREKNGWDFAFYDDIESVRDCKINCGDYTTDQLDGIIVIERKASASEIAGNLGKKTNRDRFYREFTRMKDLKKAYIVCEFSEHDVYSYPKGANLPRGKADQVRINGRFLRKLMHDIEEQHPNIEVVFCGDRSEAEKFTYDILKYWENNREN